MNVVSYSRSASAWLRALAPSPEWTYRSLSEGGEGGPVADRMDGDLVVVAGESEIDTWPAIGQGRNGNGAVEGGEPAIDRQRDSRSSDEFSGGSRPTDRVFVWDPRSLKSVMDSALRLARAVDRSQEATRLLAERESRLRRLSEVLDPVSNWKAGKRRSGGPRCLALGLDDGACRVLGYRVPDLIDRAGGQPLVLDAGDPPIVAHPADLSREVPEIVLLATEAGLPPAEADLESIRRLLEDAGSRAVAYLVSAELLHTSGPELYRAVFIVAAALHSEISALEGYRSELHRFPPSDARM